jgi:hypothetical protein
VLVVVIVVRGVAVRAVKVVDVAAVLYRSILRE